MLGSLAHFRDDERVGSREMPELERLMLHRLAELDGLVRQAYADFDFKRIFAALSSFMTNDLSAFYFDIRKDALYCDPISSTTRKACAHRARSAVPLHRDLARADAAASPPKRPGCARYRAADGSVHLRAVPRRAGRLARRCAGREVAQGPHRPARRDRRAGDRTRRKSASAPRWRPRRSSTCPNPTCSQRWSMSTWPRSRITSAATLVQGEGPAERLPPRRRQGRRGRSDGSPREGSARAPGRSSPAVGADPRLSRRHAARRPGAARMGGDAQGSGMTAVRA